MKRNRRLLTLLLALLLVTVMAACSGYSEGHGILQGGFESSSIIMPESSSSQPQSSETEPEPEPVVEELVYVLPEDFAPAEDIRDLWYAPDYPYDPSSIALDISDKDYGFDTRTKKEFEEFLQKELDTTYEGDTGLEITLFRHTFVDDWPAIRLEYTYKTDDGLDVSTTVLLINVDKRYMFTFTDTTADGEWQDAFEDVISSIRFVMLQILPPLPIPS